MERYADDQVKALLIRPDRRDEPRRYGNLGGMRQWIEPVYDTGKGQLDLERYGGRTPAGVLTRIAPRLLPWPPPSGTTGAQAPPICGA